MTNTFFSSSGLTDKDNMNSDSTNKAHNKVKILHFPEGDPELSLGFTEEAKKNPNPLNLATVSFLIHSANTFCGAEPSGARNMKETNSQSEQWKQKAVCGAVRGQEIGFFSVWTAEISGRCFMVIFM